MPPSSPEIKRRPQTAKKPVQKINASLPVVPYLS
jgi:hypothetical protein